MTERTRQERMSAKELRAEFVALHRKLDRVLAELGANTSTKTVQRSAGQVTHMKGTGYLGEHREYGPEALEVMRRIEAEEEQ